MLEHLSAMLAANPASLAIQERLWIVPAVQAIHILAIAILVFSAFSANAALLRGKGTATATPWLPSAYRWTWGALLLLLVSGAILVVGEPDRSLMNIIFRVKMVLVLLTAALTLLLQHLSGRSGSLSLGTGARWSLVALSTAIWLAIIFCGRFIAYFGDLSS